MDILTALNWRYAVKKFSEEIITEDKLNKLLEATRLSASAFGLQPYKVLVVKSGEIKKQLVKHSFGQDKVLYCSHLIIFAAQTNLGMNSVDKYIQTHSEQTGLDVTKLADYEAMIKNFIQIRTKKERLELAEQQIYLALGNMLTSAALLEIDTCPMSGFNPQGYDKVLGLADQNLTTTVICPIGKRASDDAYATIPKVRFEKAELIQEY